jgi:DNA invertase Pin-like site-specific DNA recombinase
MTNTARCSAVSLRVSTDRQQTENQVEDVKRLAAARGYEPVVYEEVESAARPVFDGMMNDVRAGGFTRSRASRSTGSTAR